MSLRNFNVRAGSIGITRCLLAAACLWGSLPAFAQSPAAPPAPLAVGAEAEDFKIEKGWKVMKYGEGNYMVDTVGFCHVSGETLLSLPSGESSGAAMKQLKVPSGGTYRLWVRYEYPAWTDVRFKAVVEQNGKTIAEKVMGTRESTRLLYGQYPAKAQHDPSWGPEGIAEECIDAALAAGDVTIKLMGVESLKLEGVAGNRNIDLVYLTNDLTDAWAKAPGTNYPLLNAFMVAIGPRWEARFTNKGNKPGVPAISYIYNRVPWYGGQPTVKEAVAPGQSSPWIPLTAQDTAHFSSVGFSFDGGQPLTVTLRPAGGGKETEYSTPDSLLSLYMPTYAGTPIPIPEAIDAILKVLNSTKAPGKEPTQAVSYGGWTPVAQKTQAGKKYAELFKAMGMRGMPSTETDPAAFSAIGIPPTKSISIMAYRNPPTAEGIAEAAKKFPKGHPARPYLRWFDYGDEIAFSEWMALVVAGQKGQADAIPTMFRQWLAKNRPGFKAEDYWLGAWGNMDAGKLKPDSSAAAASEKPRLYVDSLIFYEDSAIEYVAKGKAAVKAEFGDDVLCGANYSCHPFYQPSTTMYIKWFRGGAADFGRHSEYFWQIGQPGPAINGYVAEHFRAGMRFNPKAVNRQYTMPHSPANTDASFRRTAYTHLAHGAKSLDYFGIGMNDTFTENFVDHRDRERFRAMRDVNYSMGFVEDLLPDSIAAPTGVAMLVSESTERWDFAGMAMDLAGHDLFGANFRKNRLNFHLDRFGMWQALTFAGSSPDLLIEEDLNAKLLAGYKVLFVVGDSVPASVTPALEEWVKNGGTLVATGGVGRFGMYREPNPQLEKLVGIESRKFEERDTFMRIMMELPFIKPNSAITLEGGEMPVVGNRERITPVAGAKAIGVFADDKSPAVIVREVGKGKIYYVAAQPGVSYLWSGLRNPTLVPDRGANTHTVRTEWDKAATGLIASFLKSAQVDPVVSTAPSLIDTRLIKGKGAYMLPLANYNSAVGQDVAVSVKMTEGVASVESAYSGKIEFKSEGGRISFTVPKLGYGDIIRINTK